jgi:hypothetical protein
VAPIVGLAHHRDDLLDGWRVGGVVHALVARSATGVVTGHVAGERRRRAESRTAEMAMGTSSHHTADRARCSTTTAPRSGTRRLPDRQEGAGARRLGRARLEFVRGATSAGCAVAVTTRRQW